MLAGAALAWTRPKAAILYSCLIGLGGEFKKANDRLLRRVEKGETFGPLLIENVSALVVHKARTPKSDLSLLFRL